MSVPPHCFLKALHIHLLSFSLFHFQPQGFDLSTDFTLLLFIPLWHPGKAGIVNFAGHIVLIQLFKEHIQFLVKGQQSVQLPLFPCPVIFLHLCRTFQHGFYKITFVLIGKDRQAVDTFTPPVKGNAPPFLLLAT